MKNLYIDFDGVILDTIRVSYEEMEKLGIINDEEKKTEYYANLDWEKFLETTPQINDSINCIKKIIESSLYDVMILTHVHSLKEAACKVRFIRKYLPKTTVINVPKELSKTDVVYVEGSILIDDYTNNIIEWEEKGGIGVRFSTKLNGKGFKVIDRLDQVLDIEKL